MLMTACTPERDPGELFAPEGVDVLVVDAVLIVDRDYPVVKLTRTLAPNVPFTPGAAAETGAVVTITTNGYTVAYRELPDRPGRYGPLDLFGMPIQPGLEYLLSVTTLAGEVVTARTRTPERFAVDSWLLLDSTGSTGLRSLQTVAAAGDSVYTRPENQITYAEGLLEARFAPGGAGVFGGGGYQLALFSIDLDSDYVIEPPFFEDEDFESLTRAGSSPVLAAEEGRVRLPWFGVFYQGRYLYKVFVVDRNWFDFVRSTPQNGGGLGFGGSAGDSFGNPIFHVEGGIGLFGSAAVDSVGFFILPLQQAAAGP